MKIYLETYDSVSGPRDQCRGGGGGGGDHLNPRGGGVLKNYNEKTKIKKN